MPHGYAGRHRHAATRRAPSASARALPLGVIAGVLGAAVVGYLGTDALAADRSGAATVDLTVASRAGSADVLASPDEAVVSVELAGGPGEALLAQRIRTRQAAADRAALAAAQAEAARLEAERQAAAERAARDAQREAVVANARQDPRAAAQAMVADRGWDSAQFQCLDRLWTKESMWSYTATNRSSGAYGIPQALPGSKMGSVADDWRTNPVTQITWGLNYITAIYGTPCNAWSHSQGYNWY